MNNHFDEKEIEKGMKETNNNNNNNNNNINNNNNNNNNINNINNNSNNCNNYNINLQNQKKEMYTIKKKEIMNIQLINQDDNNSSGSSKESSTSSSSSSNSFSSPSIITMSSFFSNINNIYDDNNEIGFKENKIYNNTIIYRSTSQHKNLIPLYEHYYKVSKSTKLIFTTDQFDPKVDIDNGNLIVFAKGLEPLIQENFEFYCLELIHLFEILKKNNAKNMKILLLSLNSQFNSFLNSSLIGLIKYYNNNDNNNNNNNRNNNNNNHNNNNNQFISIDFDNDSYYNNNIFKNIELIMNNYVNNNNNNNNNNYNNNIINNDNINNNNNIIQIINNKIFKEYHQLIDEKFNNKKDNDEIDRFGKTVLITGQDGFSIQFLKWIINKRNTNIRDIIVMSKSTISWEIEKLIDYCNKSNDNKITIHFKHLDISKMYLIKNALNQIYNNNNNNNNNNSNNNNNISPIESIFHFATNINNYNNFKKFHECNSNGSLNLHEISIEMKWNLKTFLLNGANIFNNIGEISSNEVLESLNNYRRSIGLSSNLVKWSSSNNCNNINNNSYNNNNDNNDNNIIINNNYNNNIIDIIEFSINNQENYSNISIL
ncbi:hypothetical protein ACTFIU_003346 [Dictyostelium citrinum]